MLHVLVGANCNNNCLFCMEADRQSRELHIGSQPPSDIRRMILAYPEPDEILFTSGEPTLCPHLPDYISWAAERGFLRIGLITNGRRLAYSSYAQELVHRGLNRITISIHGHTAKLHDGLTRSTGSFEQTSAALLNVSRLKRTKPLRLHTSTVVNKRNLPHLSRIRRFLADQDVDEMVFNVMMAKGRGSVHFNALMPRYSDVVSAFQSLCATLTEAEVEQLSVVDIPPCVSRRLPRAARGALEDFDQFETLGSTGLTELEVRSDASDPNRAPRRVPEHRGSHTGRRARWLNRSWWLRWANLILDREERSTVLEVSTRAARSGGNSRRRILQAVRQRITGADLNAQNRYYVTNRTFKDRFLRVKGEACTRCSEESQCPGVWERYIDEFGWSDIEPVSELDNDFEPER